MKKYVLVETTSTFKHQYVIELDKDQDKYKACYYVERELAEEITQDHIGESVIGVKEITRDEMCKIARDYMFSSWTDEQIDERLVNRYENSE